jgi:hypothetical protein
MRLSTKQPTRSSQELVQSVIRAANDRGTSGAYRSIASAVQPVGAAWTGHGASPVDTCVQVVARVCHVRLIGSVAV